MTNPPVCNIPDRRSRFATRLPDDRAYTASHFWLLLLGEGVYRVGFTQFATRMLGDLVEHGYEVEPGAAISLGDTVGWVEAFKATTDLYCPGTGTFLEMNTALETDPTLFDSDPYGRGWLYTFFGEPDPGATDVAGYVAQLDKAIDQIMGKPHGDE
jgi:glycine cleavage system H protein